MMRSRLLMKLDSALSSVVLPEPVPPEISTLRRERTMQLEQDRHPLVDGADLDQPRHRERHLGEFADRDERTVDRAGRHQHVDAAAVGKARIDPRLGFIDTAADRADDLLDHAHQMALVLESRGRLFEPAHALDIDLLVRVDQDVGHGRVLEERLERSQAQHFVEHLIDELVILDGVQRDTVLGQDRADERRELAAQFVARDLVENAQIEQREQLFVQIHFERGVPRR